MSTTTLTAQQNWNHRAAPFTTVVQRVTDWEAPSPCAGWTARDVLTHVIDTESEFLRGHDLPLDENPPAGPAAQWEAHSTAVARLLADEAVASRTYDGHFGPTTIGATMTEFYGFDLLVHRWDIAHSQNIDEELTTDELEAINTAVDGWGEHAYAPGIFGQPITVADDAGELVRTLARTGRRAG